MATSNLISKSLGSVLTQSGNGSPNHIAVKGTIYVDQTTSILYVNVDNSTSWVEYNKVSYGNMYISGSATIISTPVTNTWYSLSGSTWLAGTTNGVTFSGGVDTLNVQTGKSGKYLIIGNGRINRSGGNSVYELGISINNASPAIGYYNMSCTVATETSSSISVHGYFNLSAGDTVQLAVRNITGTSNILVSESSLTIIKLFNT
jgi:hypothetical protein